jgi:choline dehydrogenase-like flavoprotein
MIYDICIIGSGAGAGPIAYELSKSGKKVVVLEKGGLFNEESFSKDELAIVRREMYAPNLEDEFHIIYERDEHGKTTRYDGRESNWSFWNGSMVGGSSNLMSGYFHKMQREDFKLRSTYGDIDGANVIDWAISLEDLNPYYKKVDEIVGVSGKNLPYPPLKTNKFTDIFDKACERLGFKTHEIPRAILSKDKDKRDSCYYSNFCGSYPCASGAKGSSRASLLNQCSAKIMPNSFVYKLESDGERVTKAHYFDKDKNSHTIEAKIFVIATQAIESARLLLNSKDKHFPNGLANNNNQVGKNLIFSAGGTGSGRIRLDTLSKEDQKNLMQIGVFFNRSLKEWQEFTLEDKKVKGGVIDFLFEHQNIISRVMREVYDRDGNLLWGERLKKKIKEDITRSRVVTYEVFNDWLPTDECYVDLEKGVKDKWGIDVAAIHLNAHPHDLKVGKWLSKKAKKVLLELGAEDIKSSISSSPPANLVAGGCRFGDDAKSSVLDKNCKTWELDNLYVSDASFMPTGGSVPYTYTIYANSFRVADILLKKLS